MRMQEVVGKLREYAPDMEQSARYACLKLAELRAMLNDARRTESPESRLALVDACADKAATISGALGKASGLAEALNDVNRAYKAKLGPRAKASGDLPGQTLMDFAEKGE